MVGFSFVSYQVFHVSYYKKFQHAFAKAAQSEDLGRKTKSADRIMIIIQTKLLKGQKKLQLW